MSNQFKLIVLAFLAADFADKYERFNKAFELYKKTPGKNIGFETKVNRVGYTDEFLESMLYDLKKLNDISDVEVVEEKNRNKPVVEFKPKAPPKAPGVKVGELELPLEFIKGVVVTLKIKTSAKTADGLQAAIDKQSEEVKNQIIDLANSTKVNKIEVDFENVTATTDNAEDTTEPSKSLPDTEEQSLREEFPFLNDEDCPEIMYVVVGKRIAAHKRYESLHALLQQIEAGTFEGTEEQKLAIVQDTEAAFAENRALWEELNHYAEKGEILGKHELFRQNQLKKEVDEMSKEELVKFIPSSATFFSRKKSELAKAKDADKIAKIQLAIDEREYKLKLVNEKLGVGK